MLRALDDATAPALAGDLNALARLVTAPPPTDEEKTRAVVDQHADTGKKTADAMIAAGGRGGDVVRMTVTHSG